MHRNHISKGTSGSLGTEPPCQESPVPHLMSSTSAGRENGTGDPDLQRFMHANSWLNGGSAVRLVKSLVKLSGSSHLWHWAGLDLAHPQEQYVAGTRLGFFQECWLTLGSLISI